MPQIPPAMIVAVVRDEAKAKPLQALGVTVRHGDYNKPSSLSSAFAGIHKLLLIPAHEFGKHAQQHGNVIDAASHAGVRLLAYTGLLNAAASP